MRFCQTWIATNAKDWHNPWRDWAIELIIFDKDGVLLDLSQNWFPAIVAIARHAETCIEGRVHHRQLLEAIGVMLDADGEGGRVLENGLYASSTYSALVPAWAALDSQLAHIMTHSAPK